MSEFERFVTDKRRRMRIEIKPKLKTVALTLRQDEVEYLDLIAKKNGRSRQRVLRGILRGGMENPLPEFYSKVVGAEVKKLNEAGS